VRRQEGSGEFPRPERNGGRREKKEGKKKKSEFKDLLGFVQPAAATGYEGKTRKEVEVEVVSGI